MWWWRPWPAIGAGVLALLAAAPFIRWAACNRSDDFLITLRYARNAAEGSGIVFSAGQVYQGFTSPLQFLVGLLLNLVIPGPETVPTVVCLVGLVAIITLALNLCHWITRGLALLPLAVALGLAFSSALLFEHACFDAVWCAGLAATGLSLLRAGHLRWAGVVLGLAVLARHDAALLLLLVCLLQVLRRRWRALRRVALTAVALCLPWYSFATWYFGSPLPRSLQTKMLQGQSGHAFHDRTLWQALELPVAWFPLHDRWMRLAALLLSILALSWWWLRRREGLDPRRSAVDQEHPGWQLAEHPLTIFCLWSVLHFVTSFVVLDVPSSYAWYHVNISWSMLALLGLWPVWLAAHGQRALERCAAGARPRWRDALLWLCTAGAICLPGFYYVEHYRERIPRKNPGRYRHAGYRQAADWLNANAEPKDRVSAGEIGVLGWYCPLYIEDLANLTMADGGEQQLRFRYAVRTNDPRFPPSMRIRTCCDLVARFPTPFNDVLVYKKRPASTGKP